MYYNKNIRLCALFLSLSMLLSTYVCALDPIQEDSSVLEIEVDDMTVAEKARFSEIISLEADVVATAFSEDISAIKTKSMRDFAGNTYTLVECQPSGYMIYHNASGQFVETSATSPSPYLKYTDNLYYGGPTHYYVLIDGEYVHTVLEETYSENDIDAFVSVCTDSHEYFLNESNAAVLNYIENGQSTALQAVAQENATSEDFPSYITNAYCLNNCATHSEMSYFAKGACGYIAAALLMLWYRETIDYRYLTTNNSTNESYVIDKNGSYVFCGNPTTYYDGRTFSYNLWRYHSEFGQADYENGYYGSAAAEIAATLDSYVSGRGLPFTYDTDVLPTTASIIQKLDSRDRPYLLFGRLQPKDESKDKCDHTVVVYGHWNDSLICHFGWSNYTCSSVKGTWGSGLMLYQ